MKNGTSTHIDDDEISTILRHFRPKPGFISSASSSKGHEWMKSGSSSSAKKQQKYNRGYTSVQYIAPTSNDDSSEQGKIRLSYLHTHQIMQNDNQSLITFEISVVTKVVTCVDCNAPTKSLSEGIQLQLNKLLCNELSTTNTKDTATATNTSTSSITNNSSPSLFLIASQLLQLLNNNFQITISSFDDNIECCKDESFNKLVSRVVSNHTTVIDLNACVMIDVQTLLMRCAAAGRNRSKVCTPVPVEFNTSSSGGDDALSHRIFRASNQLYMNGFRGQSQQQQMMEQQYNDKSEDAKTLLMFLLSLPWTSGSRLDNSSTSSSTATTTSSKSKVAKLTININTALGSPSPSFTAHANKYGTITAYHGTKIESTWSIINHGLINLSYHGSLSANGAMLGEGVYLSSSKQVAEYFAQSAAQGPVPVLASAFQHECILHLLCLGNVDISDLEPLNSYDITCLPVFEATIIKPSTSTSGDEKVGSSSNTANNKASQNPTIQDGKYYVCKDSEYIRLTKLHLTIELRKKTSILSWITTSSSISLPLIVVVIALLLHCFG